MFRANFCPSSGAQDWDFFTAYGIVSCCCGRQGFGEGQRATCYMKLRVVDISKYLEQPHYRLVELPACYRLPDSLHSPPLPPMFLAQLPLKETASVRVMGTYCRGSCEKERRSKDWLYLWPSPVVFQIPPLLLLWFIFWKWVTFRHTKCNRYP